MITLADVSKSYPIRQGRVTVLDRVNLQVAPGEKIGILGRNGAGKSTVIRLISGAEQPDSGSVSRSMTVSWPIAFGGAFQNALTGLDNLRFICRIYGVDPEDKIGFVDDFAELGRYLREPVKSYSAGMRARLAFAISMVIEFDCFLIDEVVAVGDDRFKEKCQHELFEKRRDRAMIIVSHSHNYIKQHCERIALLRNGNFTFFDDMDEAYDVYASASQLRTN
jgi:ABC-type polysaccharide/polyol phosphate transport system ATPase subunit